MGRQARATPEELARACEKLQADDNLTIHTLRHELGGGGAEYLTRGLREWRQQQADEARAPVEQMVSAAMRAALADEMQRVGNDAAQTVHALYADDRAQLDFCLAEVRRLEQEAERRDEVLAGLTTSHHKLEDEKKAQAVFLAAQIHEQKERAERLAIRFDDLQRQDKTTSAELAVAREQRMRAEQRLEDEQKRCAAERAEIGRLSDALAETTVKLAAMEERCTHQQETVRYMRADLESKTHALEIMTADATRARHEAQTSGESAARAQAALDVARRRERDYFIFDRAARLTRVAPFKSGSKEHEALQRK